MESTGLATSDRSSVPVKLPPDIPRTNLDPRTDPEMAADPYATWDRLREEHRFIYSDAGPDPIWIATRYEDIHRILQDSRTFSSEIVTPYDEIGSHRFLFTELDGIEHKKHRQPLVPMFSPKRVTELEATVRDHCVEMIESFVANRRCELISDFASQLPSGLFMGIMGLPAEESEVFVALARTVLHTGPAEDPDGSKRGAAFERINALLTDLLESRRIHPADDLITAVAQCRIDGETMSELDQRDTCFHLFLAGLDTIQASIGYMFWHLATHPADRQRVVADPRLIPHTVEEMLRYYAIVSPGRILTRDVEFEGCPMKRGDRVLLPLAAANRDGREIDDAGAFQLDRSPNRHLGFGAGPHRCIGSNLARTELAIVLEEWHRRIPDYRVVDGAEVTQHAGFIFGVERLPLEWP